MKRARLKPPARPALDLTGYTCFTLVSGASLTDVRQLLQEFSEITGVQTREYRFQMAAVPEDPGWILLSWPRAGSFYHYENLALWLLGYREGFGGDFTLNIAFPPESRREDGPFLSRPFYGNPLLYTTEGIYKQQRFCYDLASGNIDLAPPEVGPYCEAAYQFFLNGLCETDGAPFNRHTHHYDRRICESPKQVFRLEWLEHLERLTWSECTIMLDQ